MISFMSLPAYLAKELLIEWVEIEDVVRTDAAMSNGEIRKSFADIAYSINTTYAALSIMNEEHLSRNKACAHQLVKWAISRSANLQTLLITPELGKTNVQSHRIYLETCGHAIKTISFRYGGDMSLDTLAIFCKLCPNVEDLDCGPNYTIHHFTIICNSWPKLTTIHFNNGTDEASVKLVATCCTKLRIIHTHNFDFSLEKWETLLSLVGSRLQELYVIHGTVFSSAMSGETYLKPELLIKHCPQLVEIDLYLGSWPRPTPMELVIGCPHLRSLSICDHDPSDASLAGLLNVGGAHLTKLDISFSDDFYRSVGDFYADECVAAIISRCPNLTWFEFCDQPSFGICPCVCAAIGRYCSQLTTLRLSDLSIFDDGDVRAVAKGCPRLKIFDIAACSSAVTDVGLLMLMGSCPQLSELNVVESAGITGISLQRLPQLCPHMQILTIHGCTFTLADLATIAHGCRQLRFLDAGRTWASNIKEMCEASGLFRPGLRIVGAEAWING